MLNRLSLSLYGARGQTGGYPALEDQDHDDDGGRDDDGRGRDRADRLLELRRAGEERERRRHGAGVVGRGQRVGEDEVVPREDEDEDRGREHARRRERDDHLAERLEG